VGPAPVVDLGQRGEELERELVPESIHDVVGENGGRVVLDHAVGA
jgi:hypothetical protein